MKKMVFLGIAGLILGASCVYADTGPYQTDPQILAKLEQLTRQVTDLQTLVKEQASEIKELKSVRIGEPERAGYLPSKEVEQPKWLEGLTMGGDLRLRYEAFSHSSETMRDQNRFRFRLRYGVEKKFNENLKVGFRLASGPATDPTTTNQSFDTLFTPKAININQAYAVYTPAWLKDQYNWIEEAEIGGGKFSNPYKVESEMVWDHDVEPEGVYEKFKMKLTDDVSTYVVLGQYILEEDSTAATDAEVYAYRGGFRLDLAKWGLFSDSKPTLDSSVSYYDYSDFATDSNFGALANGNSNDDGSAGELDARDFNVLNFYNELALEALETPVRLFSDYALNLHEQDPNPDGENDGWGLGIKLGGLKKKGDWELAYRYFNIEANAVVGAFSDSDIGAGFADNRGSVVKMGYQLTDHTELRGAAYFFNRITGQAGDDDVRRFQADMVWKF